MFNSPIDEIKNRLEIVGVIGNYIKLQKAGANFRTTCPFHSEQKPSFFVSPARQIWHCFGCGKGGDIFGFVKEIERVEFGDALRILAQKAGVELKKEDPKLKTERSRLYDIYEFSAKFFEKQLQESKTGETAKNYLLSRGITQENIEKWRIGYAPDIWQSLSDFLVSKGYQREEIIRAGLAVKKERDLSSTEQSPAGNIQSYDRFRGRIIFPIFDMNSQVIGFGGRVFGEKAKTEIAKYVNTPNTLLYDKGQVLYGLQWAKEEIRKQDFCILVEGYTDVIMVSQAGHKNVVATSGTALSPHQLRILKRYSENLFTAFDMDVAGDSATKRGIDLAQSFGFNIKVVVLPEGSDPADIVCRDPKEWQRLVQGAKSIYEFYFDTTFARLNPKDPGGKKEISKILLPVIKRIPNKIEQNFWVQELAKKLEVKEESVEEELKKIKDASPASYAGFDAENVETKESSELNKKKSRKELLEEEMIVSIFRAPENLNLITTEEMPLFSSQTCQIINCIRKPQPVIKQTFNEKGDFQIEILRENLPPELIACMNYFALKSEVEEFGPQDFNSEFKKCLKEIKIMEIKNKLEEFSKHIQAAEREKNLQKAQSLLENFHASSKSLRDLEDD